MGAHGRGPIGCRGGRGGRAAGSIRRSRGEERTMGRIITATHPLDLSATPVRHRCSAMARPAPPPPLLVVVRVRIRIRIIPTHALRPMSMSIPQCRCMGARRGACDDDAALAARPSLAVVRALTLPTCLRPSTLTHSPRSRGARSSSPGSIRYTCGLRPCVALHVRHGTLYAQSAAAAVGGRGRGQAGVKCGRGTDVDGRREGQEKREVRTPSVHARATTRRTAHAHTRRDPAAPFCLAMGSTATASSRSPCSAARSSRPSAPLLPPSFLSSHLSMRDAGHG
ncbi:hypothetical protein K438DRAFT_1828293 [Mycena galopus ATCC 62051]|nr:hypothetical protein K438DRAFT_1828293 [Mycena galopus ATCC 62051]